MTKQTILIGSHANDHTGDPLRTAFDKVNDNFTELYSGVSLNGSTGDWGWPLLNGGHTRATLGGTQNSYIEGQSPGGLLLYNDSCITLNSGSSNWVLSSDGIMQLPIGADIVDDSGASVLGGGGSSLDANGSLGIGSILVDKTGINNVAIGLNAMGSTPIYDIVSSWTVVDGGYNPYLPDSVEYGSSAGYVSGDTPDRLSIGISFALSGGVVTSVTSKYNQPRWPHGQGVGTLFSWDNAIFRVESTVPYGSNSVVSVSITNAGSGLTDGTYEWLGLIEIGGNPPVQSPLVTAIVSGGQVISVELTNSGLGVDPTVNYTTGHWDINDIFVPWNCTFSIIVGNGSNNIAIGSDALQNSVGNSNVALGYQALLSNTIGEGNIATGTGALKSNTLGNWNIATGVNALYLNTTGYNNIATGYETLYSNTTGDNNIATGPYALYLNTTGSLNIATGSDALLNNTTGSENIATGYRSLFNNTTGNNNIATGIQTLFFNTTGYENIATGYNALFQNTTGFQNIATGSEALLSNTTGQQNIATGLQALFSNTTGSLNIATGYYALSSNTTGYYNIATGVQSLQSNTTGHHNIATGINVLVNNTTGNYNIATGDQSLANNETGNYNIATGDVALFSNTTGNYNIATGSNALYSNATGYGNIATGHQSLVWNTTGDNNIGIGAGAGQSITTGSNNTIIGSLSGSSNLSSTVLIGAGLTERIKVNSTGLYINGSSQLFNGSNSPVPTTSKGISGDKLGMLAFDSNYIYYCTANYTTGSADIWNRTSQTVGTWS